MEKFRISLFRCRKNMWFHQLVTLKRRSFQIDRKKISRNLLICHGLNVKLVDWSHKKVKFLPIVCKKIRKKNVKFVDQYQKKAWFSQSVSRSCCKIFLSVFKEKFSKLSLQYWENKTWNSLISHGKNPTIFDNQSKKATKLGNR